MKFLSQFKKNPNISLLNSGIGFRLTMAGLILLFMWALVFGVMH